MKRLIVSACALIYATASKSCVILASMLQGVGELASGTVPRLFPLLLLAFVAVHCEIAGASSATINPLVDGTVQDNDHNGTFDTLTTGDLTLDMRNFNLTGAMFENRGIIDFS